MQNIIQVWFKGVELNKLTVQRQKSNMVVTYGQLAPFTSYIDFGAPPLQEVVDPCS